MNSLIFKEHIQAANKHRKMTSIDEILEKLEHLYIAGEHV